MAYDPGAIDATLAAAVGDEPGLIADLRLAFVESVQRSFAALALAVDDEQWCAAASRLKCWAASFGALRLRALASEAIESPRDGAMLARIERLIARL